MLILSYIIQHFLALILILNNEHKKQTILSYLILILAVIIFIFGNDTYDILSYTKSINSPYQFELLFSKNLEILKSFGFESRNIIYIIQFEIILFLSVFVYFLSRGNFLILFAILSVSIFYYLTLYNNLRQGFSCIFIFFAYYFLKNKKFFLTFIALCIVPLFHKSGIFFISILAILFLIFDVKRKKNNYNIKDFIKFSLILIPLTALLLSIYFKLFEFIDLPYLGYFMSDRSVHFTRSDQNTKTIILILIYLITEIIIDLEVKHNKINLEKNFNELRFFRLIIVNFIIISFIFQLYDLQSRFLFFYWFLEITMCLQATVNKKFIFFRLITILSYMFAINAINQII